MIPAFATGAVFCGELEVEPSPPPHAVKMSVSTKMIAPVIIFDFIYSPLCLIAEVMAIGDDGSPETVVIRLKSGMWIMYSWKLAYNSSYNNL